jgi:hypothetical protein
LSGDGDVCFQANTLGSCLPVFDSLIHVQVPHVLISNCCQFYGTSIAGKGEFRVYDGTVVDYIGGGWTDSTLIHVMEGATWNFAPEPFFAMGPPGFNPGLVLENYGTINNTDVKVPGNFQLNNHGSIHLSSHFFSNSSQQPFISSSFINDGELHVSGSGEFLLLGPMFHQAGDGAIVVDAGTYLTRIGASVWDGGDAIIDSAGFILLLAGTHSFAGSDSISGGGILRMENSFYGGSFPSIPGDPFINCGEIQSAAGMVVDGRLKIGPECAAYFTLHPVTGTGTIENHGVLGGTTSILPDSILNLGTISPGVSSFGTLTLTSDLVNAGELLLEVNGAQHDLIVFPDPVGPLGGALHVDEIPWPRFPVGDTVNILSTPAGSTMVFDTLIGCFDTLISPALLRVHKLFEEAVACVQPYDTILISPSLDTIDLSGPLDVTVPMTWLDDAGPRVVLRVDFDAPGFIGAFYGIKVSSTDPVHVNSFHLHQPGMGPAPPMILNEGDLHLYDTRITGPAPPYVTNAPGSFLTALGEVYIGMDE